MTDKVVAVPGEQERARARSGVPLGPLLVTLASVAGGLLIWYLATAFLDIPRYVVPSPQSVWKAFASGVFMSPFNRASYIFQLSSTLRATVEGYALGCAFALVLAILVTEFPLTERIVLPYLVGLQSLPKVAIVPLVVIWFGYGATAKVVMTFILTLFPVLINSIEGLRSTSREQYELLASLRASRWQTFWLVKFPNALPYVFTGLNLGIVYALLGALLSELVGGAQAGIGVTITQLQTIADTAGVFAALVILAIVGYVLSAIVRWLQQRIVFWTREGR